MNRHAFILIVVCALFCQMIHAQDTFYVKKKNPVVIQQPQNFNWGDTAIRDCVLTYTVEFKKPGSNIWVIAHCAGPGLRIPAEAYPVGEQRILFKEIVCIDRSGKRYRLTDRYYLGGLWVEVPK